MKRTLEEFIERARKVHDAKYDYSKSVYKNCDEKLIIICPIHGEFEQTPTNHYYGKGCRKCGRKITGDKIRVLTTDEFIKRAKEIHGNKYDYSLIVCETYKSKVKIICPIHGEFVCLAGAHIRGHGCRKCYFKKKSLSKEEFIERARKVHGDKYDYSLVEYVKNRVRIKIICPIHGVFEQEPSTHMRGSGCNKCCSSKGEGLIKNILEEKNIGYIEEYIFNDCLSIKQGRLRFDFFIPSKNMVIEFQGKQHYEPIVRWGGESRFLVQKKNDEIKRNYCKKNNIQLLEIKYDDNINEILKGIYND